MMSSYETSDEHRPVMWLRGYPVYAAHFIVIVFLASMFATVLLSLFNVGGLLNGLIFSSAQVLRGEVWRVVTYGLVNPMVTAETAWNFAMDMAIMIWFGRELERAYGRRRFLIFFAVVYLISPLLFTLFGLWTPMMLVGEKGALAIFVAFATLYPTAGVFFGLEARFAAMIAVAVYTVVALFQRDFAGLLAHWITMVFAFSYVRYQQGRIELPKLNLFRRGPKLRVLPDLPAGKKSPSKAADVHASSMAEVDALLDKIAQSGMGSLTAKERVKLDAARAELLKREPGRR